MVLADGCFDPIHWGHLRYLAEAASFGDLIVRVAPDEDITRKGRSPFQWREERACTIASLRVVQGIALDDTLEDAVKRLQPAYLVKGSDWYGKLPKAVEAACDEVGTEVLYVVTQERTSTERLKT